MNEVKELERQLRSWAPRRPSPRLEQRILASAQAPGAGEPPADAELRVPSFRLNWLAPATVALLFLCVLFNPRNNLPRPGSAEIIAVALSNQSAAAWLPGSFACGQNSLPAETFGWTNGRSSTSSIGPVSVPRGTN